ncbi:MAG: cobalamin biosynthesis protein P47K [Planctomycetes bacterium]|nr:cobalamin biosynthesis protein P47K [Planctomycetota bacterium]
MIGGFLGAGKTTAVDRLARELTERGVRVGLITNDQSSGLVDTALLRSRGFAVEEIAGGCFCCRFPSLKDAADRLIDEVRPEVFLAEPVGSCTDLLATVTYPLRRIYGDRFRIAALSVMVDPKRAARILGIAEGRSFSEKVIYVYEKQLEEADVIVVNKIDLLDDGERAALVAALEKRFPDADVLLVSARNGEGLDAWFERVLDTETIPRATMDVDYDAYAEGEAQLGWLNATIGVTSPEAFDGNALLARLAEGLRNRITDAGGEIAHLKMTLDGSGPIGQLSVVSLVNNESEPDLRESLLGEIPGGSLILNLRAEMNPETLWTLVVDALRLENQDGLVLAVEHEEWFRPARPVPTHRVSVETP